MIQVGNNRSIQFKVGIVVMALGAIALSSNLVTILQQQTLIGAFLNPQNIEQLWLNLVAVLVFLPLTIVNHKVARSLQAAVILLVGFFMVMYKGLDDCFSTFILVAGAMMAYKYEFPSPIVKTSVIAIAAILTVGASIVVGTFPSQPMVTIKYAAFLAAIFAIMYLVFERQLRKYILHSNNLSDKVRELEPISKLGKRVSSIIHALKNQVSAVTNHASLLEICTTEVDGQVVHYLTGDQLFRLKRSGQRLIETIQSSLYVSRDDTEHEGVEQVDLHYILKGINLLYLGDNIAPLITKFELADEGRYLYGIRSDLQHMLENVYTNAVEALRDAKVSNGYIKTTLTANQLVIENNGGEMTKCSSCALNEDCASQCRKFSKRGFTTKAHGSGVGMASIFEACVRLGWRLKIETPQGLTRYVFDLKLAQVGR